MKFALVNGNKVEATKGAKGLCGFCGSELIARCGEVKVNHWAHKGNRDCDPWWENETEWHRSWKNNFPLEWQEIIHTDKVSGEKHIADVKTDSDWVLEFQHSFLNPEERRSRNAFYPKLIWIVDGTRRKTDKIQFEKVIKQSIIKSNTPPILLIELLFPEECRLLKEWHDSNVLVFFDFEETKDSEQSVLWFLFPKTTNPKAYIWPFQRQMFIDFHNNNKFDEQFQNAILLLQNELDRNEQVQSQNRLYRGPDILTKAHIPMARVRMKRRL